MNTEVESEGSLEVTAILFYLKEKKTYLILLRMSNASELEEPSGTGIEGNDANEGNSNNYDMSGAAALMQMTAVLDRISDKVSRRERPPPSTYTLGQGINIEDFFIEYESFALEKYGYDPVVWRARLGDFLKGPLLQLYKAARAIGTDYTQIKSNLIESYGSNVSPKTSTDYVLEFQQCKYNEEEGLPGLACRLRLLAEKAYIGLDAITIENIVKQQYLTLLPSALRTPLQFQLIVNPSMTLTELIKMGVAVQKTLPDAVEVEAVSAQTHKVNSLRETSASGYGGARPKPGVEPAREIPHCSYCNKRGHTEDRCFKLKACYNCGSRDHLKVNCPLNLNVAKETQHRWDPKPQREPRAGSFSQTGVGFNDVDNRNTVDICSFCGRPGHFMANCNDFSDFMKKLVNQHLN